MPGYDVLLHDLRGSTPEIDVAGLTALATQPAIIDCREADEHAQGAIPKYEVTLPKAWGKLVSFSNNNLLLEAPDQTLRIVDVEGRAPEFPKIKVQIRWQ